MQMPDECMLARIVDAVAVSRARFMEDAIASLTVLFTICSMSLEFT